MDWTQTLERAISWFPTNPWSSMICGIVAAILVMLKVRMDYMGWGK